MSTIVRTQAELDAAINAGAENIIIDSPAGVQIDAWGSSPDGCRWANAFRDLCTAYADHLPRREPPR